jgi:hypothetical protein
VLKIKKKSSLQGPSNWKLIKLEHVCVMQAIAIRQFKFLPQKLNYDIKNDQTIFVPI